MTAPSGPFRAQLDAAVADIALRVDRDTVLQARAVLLAEASRLRDEIDRQAPHLMVGLCGSDPVSPEASQGFNQRISELAVTCRQYCDGLRQAALALDATARSYGYTDDEIASSFAGGGA